MTDRSQGFDFTGQRLVITGAVGGIGRATARIAAGLGAEVVVTDLAGSADFAEELRGAGLASVGHDCDVAARAAVADLARGVGPVDAVVAAAGILPDDDWLDDEFDATFERVMRVNALGTVNVARAWLEAMMARRYGRIVLVGSIAGRMGGLKSGPHYVMSKGGVHSLVRWLSQRAVGHGVTVNGVAPGPTRTPMVAGREVADDRLPIGRAAMPEEIAWPILFLASPAASYVSGAVLDVNGGVFVS